MLTVSVRRLHDIDRSGLWPFIAFVPLIASLILLAILANRTAFSRMIHVMRELRKDKEPPP